MTKKDLVKALQEKMGLPATKISEVVETVLDLMKDALERGEPVKIARFGRFSVKKKPIGGAGTLKPANA